MNRSSYAPPPNSPAPLIGAPANFFPSRTTGFSTAPLFPYASATFPYGYGFSAREPDAETLKQPRKPRIETTEDTNGIAMMDVRVPDDAEIWFEGSKTGQRGALRTFYSPPLETGRNFTYEIRARWVDGGKTIDQTRQVRVQAGQRLEVDFAAKK